MLSRAQNTFHHNPRLRGPVSSIQYVCRPDIILRKLRSYLDSLVIFTTDKI